VSSTMLITGASSGIGEATAKYFLEKGWNVAATMRSPDRAGSWATGKSAICPRLDVSDPMSIASAIDLTLERFGQIDVLVPTFRTSIFTTYIGHEDKGGLAILPIKTRRSPQRKIRLFSCYFSEVRNVGCYMGYCPIDCGIC
jgi:hypothetical protein